MTPNELALHPQTAVALRRLIARPSHAVLLVGSVGSGKARLAQYITEMIMGNTIDDSPYVRIVRPSDTKSIGIEAIRELESFLALSVPRDGREIRRVIIIEDAQHLTEEASNALLKTIEEPPADTILILTATSEDAVLPTIQSRVQLFPVWPPEAADLLQHFKQQGYTDAAIKQALLVSGNLPGLTSALLSGDDSHPLVPATAQARELLGMSLYERLSRVEVLSKQKDLFQDTVFVLGQMSRTALKQTVNATAATRWLKIMRSSYDSRDQMIRNTNLKLVVTSLMLNL